MTQPTTELQPTQLQRWINRATWMDGCDIESEYRQAREEGRDLSSVEAEFSRLMAVPKPHQSWHSVLGGARDEAWLRDAGALIDCVETLPYRADFPFHEPNDLEGIREARPESLALPDWHGDDAEWLRRLHGGWLGRVCGCMLGKPAEAWNRLSIRLQSEETGNWPLNDYWRMPTDEEAARMRERGATAMLDHWREPTLRPTMHGMVEDDDTNYTTIGFAILRDYGANFSPLDVGTYWCQNVPIFHTCTAERVAYRNVVNNVLPPRSATQRNPYREWIGAQIRADFWGYSNPGNPERAAEWAWRDASLSHVKNGIYGEMWVAAMLAAAYVCDDWLQIIRAGLAQVPAKCRLRADVEKIIAAHAESRSYEDAIDLVHEQWDESNHHDWCHTNSNAQVVTLALLYGNDDYSQTIARAVMPGFDTDCNGATCGSLWGVKHGVGAIPARWTEPIDDIIRTGVAGYHEASISKMAADMLNVARKAS